MHFQFPKNRHHSTIDRTLEFSRNLNYCFYFPGVVSHFGGDSIRPTDRHFLLDAGTFAVTGIDRFDFDGQLDRQGHREE